MSDDFLIWVFTILMHHLVLPLTILTGKNGVLLKSVKEFIEIDVWLLLTFCI